MQEFLHRSPGVYAWGVVTNRAQMRRAAQELADDHKNARRLAAGMQCLSGITPDTLEPPTNMVYFTTKAPAAQVKQLLEERHKILCNTTEPHRIRWVTHLDVDTDGIECALYAICDVVTRLA